MTQLYEVARPEITYPADGSVAPVIRSVWHPLEIEELPAGLSSQLPGKKIVIAGGEEQVAARLAASLEAGGALVYRYAPAEGQDETEAAAGLVQRLGGQAADGIVDLNMTEAYNPAAGEHWQPAMRRTVALLKAFYQQWAMTTDAVRIFYMPVTRLGGRMGFSEGTIIQPLSGIWAGLAKTLPREIPNCNIKILDFSPEDYQELDRIIARELYRWGLFEVGYYQGKRHTLICKMEPAAPPEFRLAFEDTVLISGGGRGIGLAMARSLARDFGCRVIVTGRSPLPDSHEPWLHLEPSAFKAYTQNMYKTILPGRKVGDIRQEVLRITGLKELYENIRAVQSEGLRIEYRACDFNSPDQIQAILAEIGPSLSGVIHNAGVDTPVRLPSKSAGEFITTISIKVNGFLNLFQALKTRQLKFLCNVGSLTGRWGGMVGQLDYSSGNEGLSRLGLWAAGQINFPVKTLCWPTWDRLGMIANFEATLKYMRAIDVNEGIYHWQRELLTGGSGEICFNGPIGLALSPVLLKGYPAVSEVLEAERLYSQLFYTGETSDFKIFNSMSSLSRIEAGTTPVMYDFRVGGEPALPVSLVLEYALAAAEWAAPEGWPQLYLQEIRNLSINLAALAAPDGKLELGKEVSGRWQDNRWVIKVELSKINGGSPQELASLEVVYNREPPSAPAIPAYGFDYSRPVVELSGPANLLWTGQVIKKAQWRATASGGMAALMKPAVESDFWTVPFLPTFLTPVAQLENIVRAGLALQQHAAEPTALLVEQISFLAQPGQPVGAVEGRAAGDNWTIFNQLGQPIVTVAGLRGR